MKRYEYMRIHISKIPQCIIDQYNLRDLVDDRGYVLTEIRRGMYGLPQAGQLAYDQLVTILAPHGYAPTRHTPGLWTHKTRPIMFSLVVDDFGIQHEGREHAEHLLGILRQHYESVSTDWTGTKYLGLTLEWDYVNRICWVSMPGYVRKALHRFQHIRSRRFQPAPHASIQPRYGAATQLAPREDTSAKLGPAGITRVQQVIGTFQHYARAVGSTMLVALSTLATQQSASTKNTDAAVDHFLDYAACNPDATMKFTASGMILAAHSDASYNSEPKARSRVGGHIVLTTLPKTNNPLAPPIGTLPNNGAVQTVVNILKNVMSSAQEAETAGLYHNLRECVPIRTTLAEMGHPQPPTPVQTDNSCATGIANGMIRQRRSKAMDMRFYWVQDRVQ